MKISKRLLMVTVMSIFTGVAGNAMANGRICSGILSNGDYSGRFRVTANGNLSYYTEYLEIENGEIRIYPTFNFQTRELSFDIRNDSVRVSCE